MRAWSTTVLSSRSPDDVRARLQSGLADAGFTGSVTSDQFELQRITSHRPATPPVLRGSIFPAATGSEIRASLHLRASWVVVPALWFAGVVAVFAEMIHDGVLQTAPANLLIPIALGIAGLLWFGGAFYYEVQQAKGLLNETTRDPRRTHLQ